MKAFSSYRYLLLKRCWLVSTRNWDHLVFGGLFPSPAELESFGFSSSLSVCVNSRWIPANNCSIWSRQVIRILKYMRIEGLGCVCLCFVCVQCECVWGWGSRRPLPNDEGVVRDVVYSRYLSAIQLRRWYFWEMLREGLLLCDVWSIRQNFSSCRAVILQLASLQNKDKNYNWPKIQLSSSNSSSQINQPKKPCK